MLFLTKDRVAKQHTPSLMAVTHGHISGTTVSDVAPAMADSLTAVSATSSGQLTSGFDLEQEMSY